MAIKNKKTVIAISIIAGVFIIITIIIFLLTKGEKKEDTTTVNGSNSSTPTTTSFFQKEGKGFATMEQPQKAYLDPLKSSIEIIGGGDAKYVLVSDPNIYRICDRPAGSDIENSKLWWAMPAGDYLIYPYGTYSKILISWNIDKKKR